MYEVGKQCIYNIKSPIIKKNIMLNTLDKQILAMNKAMSFAFNYDANFIALSGITPVAHMQSKFSSLHADYGPTLGFMHFWAECDQQNRELLMEYILNK